MGSVVLKDGTKFEADLVVCGVGVAPETSYLDKSLLEKDGSLSVDENYQIKGKSDAYAIGDIATYPYKGQMVRIEHFSVAQNSGKFSIIYLSLIILSWLKIRIFIRSIGWNTHCNRKGPPSIYTDLLECVGCPVEVLWLRR